MKTTARVVQCWSLPLVCEMASQEEHTTKDDLQTQKVCYLFG